MESHEVRLKEVDFSLFTPRGHIGGVEVQLHSFLTSVPDINEM